MLDEAGEEEEDHGGDVDDGDVGEAGGELAQEDEGAEDGEQRLPPARLDLLLDKLGLLDDGVFEDDDVFGKLAGQAELVRVRVWRNRVFQMALPGDGQIRGQAGQGKHARSRVEEQSDGGVGGVRNRIQRPIDEKHKHKKVHRQRPQQHRLQIHDNLRKRRQLLLHPLLLLCENTHVHAHSTVLIEEG